MNLDAEAEKLARFFHNTYERLAPDYGYETRPETRTFSPLTKNGKLMVAVCREVILHYPNAPEELRCQQSR